MHSMHLLFTQGAKDLDIHLVLWWIQSAIQVVSFNKNHCNPDELP